MRAVSLLRFKSSLNFFSKMNKINSQNVEERNILTVILIVKQKTEKAMFSLLG